MRKLPSTCGFSNIPCGIRMSPRTACVDYFLWGTTQLAPQLRCTNLAWVDSERVRSCVPSSVRFPGHACPSSRVEESVCGGSVSSPGGLHAPYLHCLTRCPGERHRGVSCPCVPFREELLEELSSAQ